jgi:hypothetical protein
MRERARVRGKLHYLTPHPVYDHLLPPGEGTYEV